MQRSRTLLTGVAAVGLTLSVGLSACGSDDDKDASTKVTDDTATTVAKADPASGTTEDFCADYVTANLAINGMPGTRVGRRPPAEQGRAEELVREEPGRHDRVDPGRGPRRHQLGHGRDA